MSGRKPTRDLDALAITYDPPGARKEKVKERGATVPLSCEYDHIPYVHEQYGGTYREETVEEPPKRQPSRRGSRQERPYAELRAASAFSFLDGASLPEDLIHTAADRDLPAMALIDTNGVYGAPRFYSAAKKAGVRALVGAELVLDRTGDRGPRAEGQGPGAEYRRDDSPSHPQSILNSQSSRPSALGPRPSALGPRNPVSPCSSRIAPATATSAGCSPQVR